MLRRPLPATMNLIERATVIHYHRQRIARHGREDVKALGWVAEASQLDRFEVLADIVDFSHGSVIDLGCGTGDLKRFLADRFEGVSYLGIDQVPEFIALARERHAGDSDANFELGDFNTLLLPRADHVVACGSLSYRSRNPRHLYQTIARMHTAAAQTVAFNVLDAARFPDHPLLVGHPVDDVIGFCRHLSAQVEVVRGRAGDNVTVVMRVG